MAHQIYQTECFVLRFMNVGEANRLYVLLTEDLGVILATAQGIRERHSKLRGNLQLFSLARVSLVRGREVWRIVGVEEGEHLWFLFRGTENLKVVARLSALVSRLVHGEGKDGKLFGILKLTFSSIQNTTDPEHVSLVELLAHARILEDLGYFVAQGREWLVSGGYTPEVLERTKNERSILINQINHALSATQL